MRRASKIPHITSNTQYTKMKKTIIALLALSGVAFGATADELNANLSGYLTYAGYEATDAYTLTVTTTLGDGETGNLLNMDGWYLYTQVSNYLGVKNTASGDPGSWTLATNTPGTPYTGDLKVGDKSWLVNPGSQQDTFNGIQGNVTITLSTQSMMGQTWTTLAVAHGDNTTWINSDIINSDGAATAIDLSTVSFTRACEATVAIAGVNDGAAVNVAAVPEPTTATLSLLALAGLAARRRRK